MKLAIQTWGSDGDIFPFVALGAEMARRGHDVTLAITSVERKDYGQYAARLGFHLRQVGYVFGSDEQWIRISRKMPQARPFTQLGLLFEEILDPCVPSLYAAAKELAADHDMLVGHAILHPLQLAAEIAGRTHVSVMLQSDLLPTKHLPPPGMPSLGRIGNPWLWRLCIPLLNTKILPSIQALRRREGRPPVKSFRDVWESRAANIIAISPALCPRMPDWPPHTTVTGFFRLPEVALPAALREDLVRFLDEGPPPIYVTLGSMLSAQPDARAVTATTRILMEAALAAKCRAIVQSKWDVVDLPGHPDIYRIGEAPHSVIFPRCAAIVHHGGAGTTQSATLAGRPSVIVAYASDQPFWGAALERLGVAPRCIAGPKLTVPKLAAAIREVLDSAEMTTRARVLGHSLIHEDGVGAGAAILESVHNGATAWRS